MIERLAAARVVFLDFDGVIVDSTAIKSRAFGELFADLGPAAAARTAEIHRSQQGADRTTKIRQALRELCGHVADDELARREARYSERVVNAVVECRAIPGAIDFLERIAVRRPVLLSGTPTGELREIVSARGLTAWFSEILGSPPDKATSMREVLTRRGCDPQHAILIGDSRSDLEAAQAVGTAFVAVNPEASLEHTEHFPDFRALIEAAGSGSFRRAG